MPRYFFHRMDGGFELDEDGTELRDLQAARLQAVVYAGETMRERPDYVWHGNDLRVEVTNEDGALLFTVVMLAIDAPSAADLQKAYKAPQA